jgi:DNA polymerase/3'-5' exonuclease PolX
MKTTLPLSLTESVANQVLEDLRPVCERMQIAGSIRRQRASVGDVEIVAIPKTAPSDLFNTRHHSLLWAYLATQDDRYRWVRGNNPNGRYHALETIQSPRVQIDIFTCSADNWGWTLLIRTGPADYSKMMLALWKHIQRIPKHQCGSINGFLVDHKGQPINTPEEQDVYDLFCLPYQPPERRDAP